MRNKIYRKWEVERKHGREEVRESMKGKGGISKVVKEGRGGERWRSREKKKSG